MRHLEGAGLVKVEAAEWPEVLRALKAAGYRASRKPRGHVEEVRSPDGLTLVSQLDELTGCYWLDDVVLPDLLPRLGAPVAGAGPATAEACPWELWQDTGGEAGGA